MAPTSTLYSTVSRVMALLLPIIVSFSIVVPFYYSVLVEQCLDTFKFAITLVADYRVRKRSAVA